MGIYQRHLYGVAIRPLFPDRIGIWKVLVLNRSTRRKTAGARMRTNNLLDTLNYDARSGIPNAGHKDSVNMHLPLKTYVTKL